jgi:hypothetical protein
MRRGAPLFGLAFLAAVTVGCSTQGGSGGDGRPNPFLEDQSNKGKADSQYLNPDGIEVEVDLEADIEAPEYQKAEGPAAVAQFALTYLRKRGTFYLESLAEDASNERRVEWYVNGNWITAEEASMVPASDLVRWRLRGVNAVLLYDAAGGVQEGTAFKAAVPVAPFSLMQDVGNQCAEQGADISLDPSTYWYLWEPEMQGCSAKIQELTLTVSKMEPAKQEVYPEFDQLVADGKVTAVILFGQIGHGYLSEDDPGFQGMRQMAGWLQEAGFEEISSPPLGQRFRKHIGDVDLEIDLYSPREFAGLDDGAHFDNLQRAISEHEIVAYDGHSMLGASDFWSRPAYPGFYQIFLYGGCLGYEYYVHPIFAGKGSWDRVDILSSVVEVTADANRFAGPILAKMAWALENGYQASWRDLLIAVRENVGDSTFGVSGVRENCFSPEGSRCN